MFNDDMIYTFYAYNAYYYMFYDEAMVKEGVLNLKVVNATMQDKIYKDPVFGMDSTSKLTNWFIAKIEGNSSSTYSDIMTKFGLNDDQMNQIIGNRTIIGQVMNQIQNTILTDPDLAL